MSSNEPTTQTTPRDPLLMVAETTWDDWLQRLQPQTRRRQRASSSERKAVAPPAYYLLYLAAYEGDPPSLESFPTVPALVERVKEIREKAEPDDQLFLFYGKRLHISRGQLPHLVVPGLSPIPLFDMDQELQLAEDGFLAEPYEAVPPADLVSDEEDAYEYVDYYEDEIVEDPSQGQVVDDEPED